MLESYSRAWLEIDYDAIVHNLEEIRKLVGDTKIMGIVKANAYGHGDLACAAAMEAAGVDFFGVSSVDEALRLRDGGITGNILILGYTPPEHFHYLAEKDLVQSLVSAEYAGKLSAYAVENGLTIRAHTKLDTGMNRTGVLFQPQCRQEEALLSLYELPGLQIEGIFTHFPVSDDLQMDSREFTRNQIALFDEACALLKAHGIEPGIRHVQNSYGILNYKDQGYEYCRPGLLYMGVTSDDAVPIESEPDFIPLLSLKANVSYVRTLEPGMSISYGRTHFLDAKRKIATLSIGYADGLPRACSNALTVLINGKEARQVGRICMDQMMVDVTDIDDVEEGDEAIIIGQDNGHTLTVDRISRLNGTINNETLSQFSARLPRMKQR